MRHVVLDLLRGRTVIMPCHALSFLSHADWIVSIDAGGKIVEQGSYQGLLGKQDGDFAELMASHASVVSEEHSTSTSTSTHDISGSQDIDAVTPTEAGKECSDVDKNLGATPRAAAATAQSGTYLYDLYYYIMLTYLRPETLDHLFICQRFPLLFKI